ncbi:hypothetical protein GCM10010052_02610 [Paenarthrobacter histidinolovorans]|nr:hypothetical protein GCM10010052_02610 [Paenarthrobacter histidinolovorans]
MASAKSALESTDSKETVIWTISTEMTPMTTAPSAWTINAEPNIEAALRRIVWKDPSRISPNCNGRSGMTPGLGGAMYWGWP